MNTENFIETEWERRSVSEEPRLSELIELYKELGFEVYLRDFEASACSPEECSTCMMETPEKYKIIYTRKSNEEN